MHLHVGAACAAAGFVATLSPGRNLLLTVRITLQSGPAAALATLAGKPLSQLFAACGALPATMPPLQLPGERA
jgi:threonine/homoserine/homoserine lactone efflux protein